jgi:nuclear GTP-binding protein
MGKPGKKAGKGVLPPTNVKRRTDPTKTHLRDQRTIKRLKMYNSKIVRDEKGNIIKGSVLQASDRVDQQMARIAPDRRWFGNTRVIGQEALQKFRTEMGAKYRDPYSVIIKQGKLPLSLLEEPKVNDGSVRQEMHWQSTFGDKATRKRVKLSSLNVTEVASAAATKSTDYTENRHAKDRALVRPMTERADMTQNRKLFKKGQSNRIWNELYKVVDSADVILYVLDARDPMGTRSPFLEDYLQREKKYKHFVFVLNKCDLVPLWATSRWLQILSKDYPTIAFHASVNHPFGKGNLISLLRQFAKLHNVTHRGSKKTKTPISVGIVGYPNVGTSSVINTLRRKAVCKVAPIPGETKVWQYVALTRSIFMIDCPGIVYDREGNNDVQAVLKGVVRVERLGSADKTDVVDTVLQIVKKKDVIATYGILEWRDVNDFLDQLAKARGKLVHGGVPDAEAVARAVLYDWQRGRLPWFNAPPFESNQQFREAQALPAGKQLKMIEHYNSFNIVEDRIENVHEDVPNSEDEVQDDAITNSDVTLAAFVAEQEDAERRKKRREKRQLKIGKKSEDEQEEVNDDDLWAQFIAAAKK